MCKINVPAIKIFDIAVEKRKLFQIYNTLPILRVHSKHLAVRLFMKRTAKLQQLKFSLSLYGLPPGPLLVPVKRAVALEEFEPFFTV